MRVDSAADAPPPQQQTRAHRTNRPKSPKNNVDNTADAQQRRPTMTPSYNAQQQRPKHAGGHAARWACRLHRRGPEAPAGEGRATQVVVSIGTARTGTARPAELPGDGVLRMGWPGRWRYGACRVGADLRHAGPRSGARRICWSPGSDVASGVRCRGPKAKVGRRESRALENTSLGREGVNSPCSTNTGSL